MKSFLHLIPELAFLFLVAVFCSQSVAQDRRQDQEIPDELYSIVQRKAKIFDRELSESKNEWSGTYLAGDHHPTVFRWSPEHGFLVTSSLHTFAPSWVNYGRVSLNGSILTIYPELPAENKYSHIMSSKFQTVRWGKQHFLIPPSELLAFAYAAHSKAESQIVQFYSRAEDREKLRRGSPQLPPQYAKYLRMSPIVTPIIAVENQNKPWPSIKINSGSRDGIIEGMFLYHISKSGFQLSVRVTKVMERTAKAEVSSVALTNEGAEHEAIKVGWKLTSRLPKGFIEPG